MANCSCDNPDGRHRLGCLAGKAQPWWYGTKIEKLEDEIERLIALFESEQKQRLDQFDFVKTYSAAKCKEEIERLKAINAELLAACKELVEQKTRLEQLIDEYPDGTYQHRMAESLLDAIVVGQAAIANAQSR